MTCETAWQVPAPLQVCDVVTLPLEHDVVLQGVPDTSGWSSQAPMLGLQTEVWQMGRLGADGLQAVPACCGPQTPVVHVRDWYGTLPMQKGAPHCVPFVFAVLAHW